ncbi:MAG: hypothetical protein CBB68_01130 [Rhodospirillaceae bacterium TMED8]|nr:hypothetical protein [Magnetovibrio sp.]OUT53281.1 MAG: hypothetical protein CBB68_01130 [Rhodospirillaceae bacterium TMED8]|tara:strand:- start:750 stop:1352 length:603 start_codon:yes stop_codon:yes gene_type:complete
MKHNPGNRRSRNRGGGKRPNSGRNNFESNGPEVKVRGTAQQVLEKYLALARDAASAGDRIRSEACFQFAEHYYRIANADGAPTTLTNHNRRENQNQNTSSHQPDEDSAVAPDCSDEIAEAPNTKHAREESTQLVPANSDVTDEPVYGDHIDEAVLPAAVSTVAKPRRRRRAKPALNNEPDTDIETASELDNVESSESVQA